MFVSLLLKCLKRPFGGGQFKVIDVAADGHAKRTGKCFEYPFDFVVLISALGFDVEIHSCGIAQTFEEMEEHFRWHLSDAFTIELGVPHQPRPPTKIERDGT